MVVPHGTHNCAITNALSKVFGVANSLSNAYHVLLWEGRGEKRGGREDESLGVDTWEGRGEKRGREGG